MLSEKTDTFANLSYDASSGTAQQTATQNSDSPQTDQQHDSFSYEPQYARAEVREQVRAFIVKLENLRDDPIEYEGKKLDSLDAVLRYDTLNQYRLIAFGLFAILPLIVTVLCVGANLFNDEMKDVDAVAPMMEPAFFYNAVAVAGFLGFCLAGFRLNFGLKDYKTATNTRLHEIEQLITNQFADLQTRFSAAQNSFKVEISPKQAVAPFKQAIIDMFRQWREIERLPIYLRHDFDDYFNVMNDTRKLGVAKNIRLLTFVALFLLTGFCTFLAVAAHMPPTDGAYLIFSGQAGLSFGVLIAMAGFGLFLTLCLRVKPRRIDAFFVKFGGLTLALALIGIAGFGLANNSPDHPAIAMASIKFVSTCLAGIALATIAAFGIAGEIYKRFADYLIVNLVRALKTHKKDNAVKLTRNGYKDWLKGTQGSAHDWNGWTPGYEERLRAKLIDEGSDEHEALVRAACDPVIYVGNEKNRRLQAAGTDLVSAFYNQLPVFKE